MTYKQSFEFRKLEPDEKPLTKFGGQPNWLGEPQWPLSRKFGKPMRFLCQIEIPVTLFPAGAGKVAYLFMTGDEDDTERTYEPFGGENAVILQPGDSKTDVACKALSSGPTLRIFVEGMGGRQPTDVELGVKVWDSEDPEFMPAKEVDKLSAKDREIYWTRIEGNKIGGTPGFIQNDEFPDATRPWQLLLQLDAGEVPFSVNFGDVGVGYLFINPEATEGRFLWQCT